jgi:hypothetical protein
MPNHVGVKKIHYFHEHLLVFLQTVLQDARFNHRDKPVSHVLGVAGLAVVGISEERNKTEVGGVV